jgi:hypothetical protein
LLLCVGVLGFSPVAGFAAENIPATESTYQSESWFKKFGMNYNSFFAGPGLGQPLSMSPGMTGEPSDSGLNFFNLISLKYKATDNLAFDVQFRNQFVVTNDWEYRHQGQRFGVSGTFLKGDTWSFSGAFNTDLPIGPLMGQIGTERTLLVNPGFFAFFNYQPTGSRWSVFALLQPRLWVYADRNAISQQDARNGGVKQKPEYTVYVNPSINYAVNDKVGLRLGTTLEYTKFVGFADVKRNYMPMEFGVTYDIDPMLSVYTYVFTSTPIDDGLRSDQGFASNPWYRTASLNVWLSGTFF